MGGEVFTDSAAALGISQRAGIGKVRHLRTQGLWVQEVRVSGRLAYRKVLGTKNPSDVLTKHVPGELLERHIESMGMDARGGRASSAPELNSVESLVFCWTGPLAGGEPDGGSDQKLRFSSRVQFRAIAHENRGRRCREAKKCRFPGGVCSARKGTLSEDHTRRVTADAPTGTRARRQGGVVQGGTVVRSDDKPQAGRPRWADIVDDDGISVFSIFDGSGAQSSATSSPEVSGSRGLGIPDAMASNWLGYEDTAREGTRRIPCTTSMAAPLPRS